MSAAVTPNLFDCTPATPARPARGRGATPRVEQVFTCPGPNPVGERRVRFAFRPLQRFAAPDDNGKPRWANACNLIAEYFQAVGGFRIARDDVVKAWCELLDDYEPQEVSFAIAAKAASLQARDPYEAREKRIYRNRPEKFPAAIGYWLAQSEAYAEHKRLRNARQQRAALDNLMVQRLASPEEQALREQQRTRTHVRRENALRAWWYRLPDHQRAASRKGAWPQFVDMCAKQGLDPQSPQADELLLMYATGWAEERYGFQFANTDAEADWAARVIAQHRRDGERHAARARAGNTCGAQPVEQAARVQRDYVDLQRWWLTLPNDLQREIDAVVERPWRLACEQEHRSLATVAAQHALLRARRRQWEVFDADEQEPESGP